MAGGGFHPASLVYPSPNYAWFDNWRWHKNKKKNSVTVTKKGFLAPTFWERSAGTGSKLGEPSAGYIKSGSVVLVSLPSRQAWLEGNISLVKGKRLQVRWGSEKVPLLCGLNHTMWSTG
jgi:hypothetical protein